MPLKTVTVKMDETTWEKVRLYASEYEIRISDVLDACVQTASEATFTAMRAEQSRRNNISRPVRNLIDNISSLSEADKAELMKAIK